MIKFNLIAILIAVLSVSTSYGQSDKSPVLRGTVVDGDTLAMINLASVEVSDSQYRNRKYHRRFGRIQKKVVKVYPYAKAAGKLMNKYEEELAKIESDKKRKKFIKEAEEELKKEFEGEIRNMTVSEGMILIRLIDRETGDTSYELIKELRGSFSAFMWQSLARFFGSNLKQEYDPQEGDDQIIEEIVRQIEAGQIRVASRD